MAAAWFRKLMAAADTPVGAARKFTLASVPLRKANG